jgi:hypothetical protein
VDQINTLQRNIILAFFALLVVSVSTTRIGDYDFFWHLKRGEATFTTGAINAPDTFSYTVEGRPQYGGEWLADLAFFLSFKTGGFYGVAALKAALLLITFLFLFLTLESMRPRAPGREVREDEGGGGGGGDGGDASVWFYASVITLVIALFAIRFRLYARPFLFSYVFVAAFLYVISRYAKNRDARILYLLPVFELLWANTSKGAFYGPVIFAVFAAGEFFGGRLNKAVILAFVSVFVASLVSPVTYGLYLMPFKITAIDKDYFVGEHQPLTIELLWGYGFRYTALYQLLVLGSGAYFILFKGYRSVYHILLFLMFFLPSVKMIRMVDFFSLAAGVFFIRPAAALTGTFIGSKKEMSVLPTAVFSIALIALSIVSVTVGKTYSPGVGIKQNTFPEGALTFLDKAGITGPVFNSYPLGGYIIWRSPERKVFIDGRGVHYLYPVDFFNYYVKVIKDYDTWLEAEKKWGFSTAVIEYDTKGDQRHFPAHLRANEDWALVYWDNHSAVYLKRISENLPIIEKFGYRVARPTFYDFVYLDHYLSIGKARYAVTGLARDIALNPSNQEPRLARAFLLYNLKAPRFREEALKEINEALKLKPDISMEHTAAAIILLEKGRTKEAGEEVEKALALNPMDPAALSLKKRMERSK